MALYSMIGSLLVWVFVLLLLFPKVFGHGENAEGVFASFFAAPPMDSSSSLDPSLHPSIAPSPFLYIPSSPIYPLLPGGGPLPAQMTGLCNLNVSSMSQTLDLTVGDCRVPLALYVGNVICCPQFESMLHILGSEQSHKSGSLVWNRTGATDCFEDIMSFMIENGSNSTITDLCNVQPGNLTGGSCPITTKEEFEQLVDGSKLLGACSSVDPLKECCKPSCQPFITDAAVRLASAGLNDSLRSSKGFDLQQMVEDCQSIVFSWLARELGPEVFNAAFRILLSCKVNQACPLVFEDISDVAKACSGSSPSKFVCCGSLEAYISSLQRQMLITNVQALECVTSLGSMLQKKGVTVNVYSLCTIDLKDFSLQAHDEQGCLLRSMPTDIVYDNVSGISFTCDLNDNIIAPWPASSSLSSFPLCASRESLPALPVFDTSGNAKILVRDYLGFVLVLVFWLRDF